MVLEALAGWAAGGVSELFNYNRDNFLFDREMRQKQEFQILAFRNKQAELWREDVRDIIGMTEKKMDSYLVIATLQLGMCVGLFCEGRLEPGTPPWLLSFYMLTLGGAFMYLLMAVWFAMHASVVANCSSVRLLTQFVRLPVPTWKHLEDLRTYGSSYESLDVDRMLRVPFTGSRGAVKRVVPDDPEAKGAGAVQPSEASVCSSSQSTSEAAPIVADPWGLERNGELRGLYELEDKCPSTRAHIGLARRAAVQYQCFDAFARVGMTFGTNQLLNAIAYYCLGYVAIQDGAVWGACCIVCIMVTMMVTLVNVDISFSEGERMFAPILIITGPLCCTLAVIAQVFKRPDVEEWLTYLLPAAYCSHALWLLWALGTIGIQKQVNGAMIPSKFRAVLYLDVFGWLNGRQAQKVDDVKPMPVASEKLGVVGEIPQESPVGADPTEAYEEMLNLQREVRADLARWQSEGHYEKLQRAMAEGRFGPATMAFGDGKDACLACSPNEGSNSLGAKRMTSQGGLEIGTQVAVTRQATPSGTPSQCTEGREDSGDRPKELLQSKNDLRSHATKAPPEQADSRDGLGEPAVRATSSESSLLGVAYEAGKPVVTGFTDLVTMDSFDETQVEESDGLGMEKPKVPLAPSSNGPAATHSVRFAPTEAFDPASYGPKSKVLPAVTECAEKEDIVGGQEGIHPGRLPARVFRTGTAVLVVLWAIGLLYPSRTIREFMTDPLIPEVFVEEERPVDTATGLEWKQREVPGVMGTDPNGLPMFIPVPQKRVPNLRGGELVDVEWPTPAGFFPRALSSDDSGQRLVVADDIGLYTALLERRAPRTAEANSTPPEAPASARRLRAARPAEDRPRYTARFARVDRCRPLEGQALRDMSVVCTGSGQDDTCRVVILIAMGPSLTQCPLPPASASATDASDWHGGSKDKGRRPTSRNLTYTIAREWLHSESHKERVTSLAVDSHCLKQGSGNSCRLEAENVGCVVVGTSMGRIVQLRGDMDNDQRLVPDRSIHHRPTGVHHGSLHVLPSGRIVALSRIVSLKGTGLKKVESIAQAFDMQEGDMVGQWRLPTDVDWLTLSGGGDSLLALGLRDGQSIELHRFPVPDELRREPDEAKSRSKTDAS